MRILPCTLLSFVLLLACLAPATLAENWPQWRGPQGDGTTGDTAPTQWSPEQNVAWRIDLPEAANSSPVVWGDRIFLTQPVSDPPQRTLMCVDRANGDVLWQKGVKYADEESTHRTNPYCSPSPVTDGERVIVWFGSAGVVCYDLDGNELWRRDLGKQQHMWGYGSSPILYGDLCILNFGPGMHEFLIALDKRTGEIAWRVNKLSLEEEQALSGPANNGNVDPSRYDENTTLATMLRGSWTTPVIRKSGGRDELILTQTRRVAAYAPQTGDLLWQCGGYAPLAYCSPIVGDDIVVALGGYDGASLAVLPGGSGDVTETHRVWHKPRDGAWLGTGIVHDNHAYVTDMSGILRCIDVRTGEVRWDERLKASGGRGNTWGSTVQTGNDLMYVMNQAGDTFVFEPSPEGYQQLARNSLGEQTNSTPVITDGQVILRTQEGLWCIAE